MSAMVRVNVRVEIVSMKKDGPGERHWVLESMPVAEDVQISDEETRNAFVAALADMAKKTKDCPHIVVEHRPEGCSFTTMLDSDRWSFQKPLKVVKFAPTAAEPIEPAQPVLLYGTVTVPPPPIMRTLCIGAAVGSFENLCKSPDASVKTVLLKDLASEYRLEPLAPPYASIPIRTRGDPGRPDVTPQLQAAAVAAFLEAKKLNMLPGASGASLSAPRTAGLENAIRAIYQIDHSDWPAAGSHLRHQNDDYSLVIDKLQTIDSVAIHLTQGSSVAPQQGDTQGKLNQILARNSCRLEGRFRSQLDALKGTIPTNEGVWKVAKTIGLSREVRGVVIPKMAAHPYDPCPAEGADPPVPAGNRIEFTADYHWVPGALDAKVDGGLSATPHEIVTGTGQINESNLLIRKSQTFGDTGSFSFNGGPEVQRSDFAFGIGATPDKGETLHAGFEIDGVYFRDRNQRFGYLAGPKFVDEEYGAAPKLYFSWERAAESHAFTFNFRTDAGFQFRHVGIQPPAGYAPFLNHGWVNGLAPSMTALAGYDFGRRDTAGAKPKKGLGLAMVSVDASLLRARKAAGGDFDFDRYTIHAQGELFFGVSSTQDFVLRYGRGFTASSAATPLFEQPAPGGTANIRGIEMGEYVGRGFGYDQSEFGINVQSAWRWLHPSRPDPAGKDLAVSEKASLSSLGIDSVFVVGLYDRAKMAGSARPGALLDLQHAWHGSGIKGEIRGLRVKNRKANIGLIYARSPYSILHHNGVFITSVLFDF